jgi:7-cyano-7-deazaguanine synthase in queuosine biosynthesis
MIQVTDIINIFWTGGLDSTFRLVQLLTTTKNKIQPHYLLNAEESTGVEIDTMIEIRRQIKKMFPEVSDRFLPTKYTDAASITDYTDTRKQVEELRQSVKVNLQYILMSNYCRSNNIEKIEIAVTSLSGEKGLFKHYRAYPIFKYFSYPTIDLRKKDMIQTAKNSGWVNILYMTSFCRRPHKRIKACGMCGPCTDAVLSGLGFRLPIISRIKANIQIPFRNYYRKNYKKQNKNWFFRIVKQKFENKF